MLRALAEVRGSHRVTSQNPEDQFQALERYGQDLTARAREGKIDPVIGRDDEIRRVIQVLSRRTKNNPVLIGEPGVGKTAIVEGSRPAHRRWRRPRGPEEQAHRRPRPVGDGRRRQVPRRVRGAAQGRAQGDHRRGRRDHHVRRRAAHDRRRRRRRRGDGRRQHDQADARPRRAADDRRHDARRVPQARREGSGPRAPLPAGVRRPNRAWRTRSASCAGSRSATRCTTACASRTRRSSPPPCCRNRYLTNRFLPDKAIDLVDEAASKLRIEIDSMPTEIDVVERRILQLEIEQVALEPKEGECPTGQQGAAGLAARRACRAQRRGRHDEAALGGGEGGDRRHPHAQGGARAAAHPARAGGRPQRRRRDPLRADPRVGTAHRRRHRAPRRAATREADAQGGGRRRGHRRGRVEVDRRPREPPDGGRGGEVDPPRGAPPRAGRRSGRCRHGSGQRHPPQPGGAVRSPPSDRFVPVPRSRPASARPSSPERSPSSCSTTSRRRCAST